MCLRHIASGISKLYIAIEVFMKQELLGKQLAIDMVGLEINTHTTYLALFQYPSMKWSSTTIVVGPHLNLPNLNIVTKINTLTISARPNAMNLLNHLILAKEMVPFLM